MAKITRLQDGEAEAVREAADALRGGGIIIFPTDTVYGLLAFTVEAGGLARLNSAKGRPEGKPLAVLAADEPVIVDLMRGAVKPLCGEAVEQLVPGALTALMPPEAWKGTLPHELLKLPYEVIGVRIPRHAALQALLRACGGWVIATSANMEGKETPVTLEGVLEQLAGKANEICLAVDGGECGVTASAILNVTSGGIEVVRGHPLIRR